MRNIKEIAKISLAVVIAAASMNVYAMEEFTQADIEEQRAAFEQLVNQREQDDIDRALAASLQEQQEEQQELVEEQQEEERGDEIGEQQDGDDQAILLEQARERQFQEELERVMRLSLEEESQDGDGVVETSDDGREGPSEENAEALLDQLIQGGAENGQRLICECLRAVRNPAGGSIYDRVYSAYISYVCTTIVDRIAGLVLSNPETAEEVVPTICFAYTVNLNLCIQQETELGIARGILGQHMARVVALLWQRLNLTGGYQAIINELERIIPLEDIIDPATFRALCIQPVRELQAAWQQEQDAREREAVEHALQEILWLDEIIVTAARTDGSTDAMRSVLTQVERRLGDTVVIGVLGMHNRQVIQAANILRQDAPTVEAVRDALAGGRVLHEGDRDFTILQARAQRLIAMVRHQ